MKNDLVLNKTILAGFIELKEENLFEIYLINLSNISYSRVVQHTGSTYENMSSNICRSEKGNFYPNTALQVDESDMGELDFNIWYVFDLYENEINQEPLAISLSINWHYIYRQTLTQLPILNKTGRILELQRRL